jgi:hypothetical protein
MVCFEGGGAFDGIPLRVENNYLSFLLELLRDFLTLCAIPYISDTFYFTLSSLLMIYIIYPKSPFMMLLFNIVLLF